MTADELALLAAIIAAPDDDLPRLVYADWIEERGRPERAAFVRVQCRIGREESRESIGCCLWPDNSCSGLNGAMRRLDPGWRDRWCSECEPKVRHLERERELWTLDNGLVWFGESAANLTIAPAKYEEWSRVGLAATFGLIDRGFVSRWGGPAADFLRVADSLVPSPVRCDYLSPIHGDHCDGGRVQAHNAHFTQDCPKCKGTDYVPRPVTPTTQPLRKVTLTTSLPWEWFDSDMVLVWVPGHFGNRTYDLDLDRRSEQGDGFDLERAILEAEFPGIEFVTQDTVPTEAE